MNLTVLQMATSAKFQWLVGDTLNVSDNKKELKKSHTVSTLEAGRLKVAGIAEEKKIIVEEKK